MYNRCFLFMNHDKLVTTVHVRKRSLAVVVHYNHHLHSQRSYQKLMHVLASLPVGETDIQLSSYEL